MFTLFHETQGATPNINHQGVPLGPSFPDEYLVQYNKSSGLTDWNQPSSPPLFVLNSGAIQLLNYSYVYGSTGNASTAPSLVPFGETIIAETHNGGFITLALNPPVSCTIYSHAPSLPDGQINPGYYAYYHTFNPSTGRLVISNYLVFDIYDLSPTTNTFQWVVGGAIPNQGEIAHVDNQDRIYMKRNGALEQYDYSVTPGVFIPISISGFINSNIETMKSDDPYTSDICLIKNIVQGKLYAIDFSGMTEKNISTSDIASPKYYVIDGNTVYISGSNSTGTITIGSQSIPPVSLERSTYIAKFNLLSDFSLRIPVTGPVPKNVLNLQLFPNPATNSIRVTIGREVYFNKPTHYSLSIIDQMKNKVLHIGSYTSDASLDISRLLPGVYYVEIIDDKGVRSGATFLKF